MRPEAKRPKAPQNEVHMARKSATVAPTVNQLQLPLLCQLIELFSSLQSLSFQFLLNPRVSIIFLIWGPQVQSYLIAKEGIPDGPPQ